MKKATIKLFDGRLTTAGANKDYFCEGDPRMLAMPERMTVLFLLGAKEGTITSGQITPQTSGDGTTWYDLPALGAAVSVPTTGETLTPYYVSVGSGSHYVSEYLRFKITAASAGTGSCPCKVWATLRDDA